MEQLINDFSPGLFFMQLFIFLVLLFLLSKFAWKPILNSLKAREGSIADALQSAENAKEEMANCRLTIKNYCKKQDWREISF